MFENFLMGLSLVMQPLHFIMIIFGVVVGLIFGMVPGLSGVTAISLLIPFTYAMDPISGFLAMVGIYAASVYGGGVSAILFNTPGDAPAAATALDGYPLTQQGQASRALGMAAFASLVGGVFSTIVLSLVAPQAAKVALSFGAPEYFALGLLAVIVISTASSENRLKSFVSVLLGLLFATVGLDSVSGITRYTFGSIFLLAGIDFIPVIIGMFALSEVFTRFHEINCNKIFTDTAITKTKKFFAIPDKSDFNKVKKTLARSSLLGTVVGMLPGAGATIAAFLGYGAAMRASKDKSSFGKGNINGIAGPEAANNAAVGGAMIPLLTLGIPGGAVTAVMLSAFLIHGLRPGPLLFVNNPDIVYSIFVGMFFANILMAAIVFFSIRYLIKILTVPYEVMGVSIMMLCIAGTFAINNRIGDVWIMFFFGILGFFLKVHGFSVASVVLGLVLGTIIEIGLRQGMLMTGGSFLGFFTRPVSGIILGLSLIALFAPVLLNIYRKFTNKRELNEL
jgi:putative tricarboxylic transport membrane protein